MKFKSEEAASGLPISDSQDNVTLSTKITNAYSSMGPEHDTFRKSLRDSLGAATANCSHHDENDEGVVVLRRYSEIWDAFSHTTTATASEEQQ